MICPRASQVVLVAKKLPANAGNMIAKGLIPWLGRSPGGGHGNPLWLLLPENSPWTEEPGRLQSIGSQRVRHNKPQHAHMHVLGQEGPF